VILSDTTSSSTDQRLLDAVDTVIADHGPSGVTLRRVGAEAGLSHTAAAHYFKDKPGLYTAYITRSWEQIADRLDRAAAQDDDRQALLASAEAYASFALESPSAFSVMSRMELARVDTPELWAARERGFFTLAALVERAQAAGWAADRDVLDVMAPLSAPYDGNDMIDTLRRLLSDLLDSL